jgi:predicted ATPase
LRKFLSVRLTNWQVITGAPCSGKTAVVNELARRGYPIVGESAREIIDEELRAGRSLEEIRADAHGFESRVFDAKRRAESRLPADQLTFLDRALPDSIAYYALEGLDPGKPEKHSRQVRYGGVFLFERLKFLRDTVRAEDDMTAAKIEGLIAAAYAELGYAIVRVPVLPIPRRADWILAHLPHAFSFEL